MPVCAARVPREFKANVGNKTEKNVIDRLIGIAKVLKSKGESPEVILSVINDLRGICKHEPGYLAEDLILQPSKKEEIFLAQTNEGLLITFVAHCKKCSLLGRYFVGQICPNCLGEMRKLKHPCKIGMHDIYNYLPNLIGSGPWHSGNMSTCDKCDLTVVWDSHNYIFDFLCKPAEK